MRKVITQIYMLRTQIVKTGVNSRIDTSFAHKTALDGAYSLVSLELLHLLIVTTLLLCAGTQTMSANADVDALYNRYRGVESSRLQSIGTDYMKRNRTDSAIMIFTILAKRHEGSEDISDRQYAIHARLSLGVLNFNNANYAAAYSNFLTASELEDTPDSPGHMNLAAIYLYFGDRNRAYRCLRDVFEASLNSGNGYMASAAVLNILSADIDTLLVPRDSILLIIDSYRNKTPETPDNDLWRLANHLTAAKRHSINGNTQKTIEELRKAIPMSANGFQPERNRYAIYIALGRNFIKTGNADSAEYYIRKAVDIAQRHKYPELLIRGYKDLSEMYAAIGRNDSAERYHYIHLQLQDSIFNVREFGHIHNLELMHEANRFEKNINALRMEERMKTRSLTLVSVSALVLTVFLVLLFIQYIRLKSKNKSLFEKNIKLMKQDLCVKGDPSAPEKHAASPMADETRNVIMAKIKEALSDESVFCREGFSLNDLADFCGSNQKYVSRVLNEDFGKSFTLLLNECRIGVAKKRFLDFDNYSHLTMEAIVHELGFKSRSTFSKTFKKLTGLSPSEFRRLASSKEFHNTPEADNQE